MCVHIVHACERGCLCAWVYAHAHTNALTLARTPVHILADCAVVRPRHVAALANGCAAPQGTAQPRPVWPQVTAANGRPALAPVLTDTDGSCLVHAISRDLSGQVLQGLWESQGTAGRGHPP
jgi:hypothetical protein